MINIIFNVFWWIWLFQWIVVLIPTYLDIPKSFTDITFTIWAKNFIIFTNLVLRFVFLNRVFTFFVSHFIGASNLSAINSSNFWINCLDELSFFKQYEIFTRTIFFLTLKGQGGMMNSLSLFAWVAVDWCITLWTKRISSWTQNKLIS